MLLRGDQIKIETYYGGLRKKPYMFDFKMTSPPPLSQVTNITSLSPNYWKKTTIRKVGFNFLRLCDLSLILIFFLICVNIALQLCLSLFILGLQKVSFQLSKIISENHFELLKCIACCFTTNIDIWYIDKKQEISSPIALSKHCESTFICRYRFS